MNSPVMEHFSLGFSSRVDPGRSTMGGQYQGIPHITTPHFSKGLPGIYDLEGFYLGADWYGRRTL
jgi:hypothetical protein